MVKIDIFSITGKGNQSTSTLNDPVILETIPKRIAEIPINKTLSGLCIKPTLHSLPSPSALALT